ncbi:MAG: hypothetical protein B9S32_01925 [Verrucomicrobia bacterium Tous-C9LFEB]|nr:MAG: hypothetical protein B9S32_01925 [Verrucomicrobia bacterium Tous-C9LFEB]
MRPINNSALPNQRLAQGIARDVTISDVILYAPLGGRPSRFAHRITGSHHPQNSEYIPLDADRKWFLTILLQFFTQTLTHSPALDGIVTG